MPLYSHVTAALIMKLCLGFFTVQNLWSLSIRTRSFFFSLLYSHLSTSVCTVDQTWAMRIPQAYRHGLKLDAFSCTCVLRCYLSRVLQWASALSSIQSTVLLALKDRWVKYPQHGATGCQQWKLSWFLIKWIQWCGHCDRERRPYIHTCWLEGANVEIGRVGVSTFISAGDIPNSGRSEFGSLH